MKREDQNEEETDKDLGALSIFDKEKRMSYFAHLDELRKRLTWTAIVVFAAAAISWNFVDPILDLLRAPLDLLPDEVKLVSLSPLEAFMAKIKISLLAGVIATLPFVLLQGMMFLAPALKKKERRGLYIATVAGTFLGVTGVVLGYLFIFPIGIQWLAAQATSIGVSTDYRIGDYVSFALFFLAGMGVAMETPLILLGAIRFGVVTQEQLKKNWRIVYLVILISAALLTPDWSPVTMIAVAVPMAALYHLTMLFARFIHKKKQ